MKKLLSFLLFAALIINTVNLYAQSRFSATLYVGYGSGAYELAAAGIGSGKPAFRINVSYAVLPILDAYAGFNRAGFTCDTQEGESFCADEPVEFISSGLNAGLILNHSPEANIWIPWLRAGFVYQFLDITQPNDSFNYSGVGFEVATGIAYPVTEKIKIVPAFTYKRYTVTNVNDDKSAVVVISGMIGVRYSF